MINIHADKNYNIANASIELCFRVYENIEDSSAPFHALSTADVRCHRSWSTRLFLETAKICGLITVYSTHPQERHALSEKNDDTGRAAVLLFW